MKRLVAMMMFAVSFGAAAQFPSLPYNPDENGDGLIGVADLQGLLSQYGAQFSAAVLSDDQESAIVFMGNISYPECAVQCANLPGHWQMPRIEDLGLIWDDIVGTGTQTFTWLKDSNDARNYQANENILDYEYIRSGTGTGNPWDHEHEAHASPNHDYACYCAARQMRKVEFDQCLTTDNYGNYINVLTVVAQEHHNCVNEKLSNGWQLLGPTSQNQTGSELVFLQSFWRWAE